MQERAHTIGGDLPSQVECRADGVLLVSPLRRREETPRAPPRRLQQLRVCRPNARGASQEHEAQAKTDEESIMKVRDIMTTDVAALKGICEHRHVRVGAA